MSLLSTSALTLTDWATRLDPDGKLPVIVEMLNQDNEIMQDIPWIEGNLPTGHKHTIRTGLPTPTWRKLYGGVMPTKSETAPVTDACGMLEAYSEPDKEEVDLNGNTAAFRLSEATAHMEGMSQTMASTIFYGDTDLYPERFMGLAPRFNDTSAQNGANIVLGDPSPSGSDNTSIWLIGWGEHSACGIFPKGSQAGLQHTDKGQVTVQLSDGSRYEAYQDHYQWKGGLAVKDWRKVVRIANIDVSQLKHDAATGTKLFEKLAIAMELIHGMGNVKMYCNRTISAYMRTQRNNTTNVRIGMNDAAGRRVMDVDGIEVRRCDALLNTESTVA